MRVRNMSTRSVWCNTRAIAPCIRISRLIELTAGASKTKTACTATCTCTYARTFTCTIVGSVDVAELFGHVLFGAAASAAERPSCNM